jgi:hypothetical protein
MDRTLPLEVPDHLCHRLLWRERNQHVHMLGHQVPFFYTALSVSRPCVKNLAEIAPQLLVQCPAPAFRDEDHMIFNVSSVSYSLQVNSLSSF